MKINFITTLLITCLTVIACGQDTNKIVQAIAEVHEVQRKHVGFAGSESENYQNFEALKTNADTDKLLELVKHENSVVACYAGWALIDRDYSALPEIFAEFLQEDKEVTTYGGCLEFKDKVSSVFYHRYWNQVSDKEEDRTLLLLDSMVLFHHDYDWLLLDRALNNRLHPNEYNDRIATLAFEEGYPEAILYLTKWHKAAFRDQLSKALIKYLQETEFKKRGTTSYYQILDDLLKTEGINVKDIVIKKLQEDKHWKYEEESFKFLFQQYGIYASDLK